MCRNLYEEYLFTLDREYLQEIFPVLEEHARFCSNMLQKTDKGLAVVPATSPENCFLDQGEAVPVALYTENTLAIIRNLFRDYLEACEVLKKEGALSGTIREQLPAIVLTQLGSDGRILEWNEEFTEVEVEHRHLSHLYEFHPGRGITKETPELLGGVKKKSTCPWRRRNRLESCVEDSDVGKDGRRRACGKTGGADVAGSRSVCRDVCPGWWCIPEPVLCTSTVSD